MTRTMILSVFGAAALWLTSATPVLAWAAYHGGYTHAGPNGVYHVNETAVGGPRGGVAYGNVSHYGGTSTGYHYGDATRQGGAYYGTNGYHYSAGYSGATYGGGVRVNPGVGYADYRYVR